MEAFVVSVGGRGRSGGRRVRSGAGRARVRAARANGDVDLQRLMSPKGEAGCEQCTGTGSVECTLCGGTGFYTMELMGQVSSSQCRLCNGRRRIPCPTCKRHIYLSVDWWDVWKAREAEGRSAEHEDHDALPRIRWNDPPI